MHVPLIAFTPDIILFSVGTCLILIAIAIRLFSSHNLKNMKLASKIAVVGVTMIILGFPILLIRAASAINIA